MPFDPSRAIPPPNVLLTIAAQANAAERTLSLLSNSPLSPSSADLRALHHARSTRDVLLGTALPAIVGEAFPDNRFRLDLVGGPGPIGAEVDYPAGTDDALAGALRYLCVCQQVIYVPRDFFARPAPALAETLRVTVRAQFSNLFRRA